jgi:Tfp pilus assembly protein PilF
MLGRIPVLEATLGFAYARAGRTGEAHKILEGFRRSAENAYVPAWAFAVIYIGLGETDKAFDWLEKALDEASSMVLQFHVSLGDG